MSRIQEISKFIDYVKKKIERCIQHYMSLEQAMTYLQVNHKICHSITRAIWEQLQKDNPGFFKEYYKRCEVARQIAKFNDLLAQQIYLMQKFGVIELSATMAPVTQLQKPNDHHQYQLNDHHQYQLNDHHQDQLNNHHQDQSHDQWNASNDLASLIDPSLVSALPQSDLLTSGFEFEDFEEFARDFNHQQPQQEHGFTTTLLVPEQPPQSEPSNNLDPGDAPTNNNSSDPKFDP